jgi:hypothetical protein
MTHDVFISHAGDDASLAVEVCALLESRGLKCWMAPRDVAAGMDDYAKVTGKLRQIDLNEDKHRIRAESVAAVTQGDQTNAGQEA